MEQTRSQRFIQEYARLMKSSAEFFNKDSVLMSREDYDNAKLRVLVVFPSPASTKAVSMTAAVLNDYVISSCPGVFIDFAYVPEQDDLKYYDKANMPYAIGNVTHLDASHFDIVGFSISILFESISVAWIMNSFTRCDKPLPLTWSERKDKKLSEVPVFYAGGITCSVADILFGELGDGRQAFLDYLHLGEFHCSKLLFDHYLVSREKGRTVQEMIDTFWKEVDFNEWLYQPQAYKVEFNDKNQIVKNVKINPNAPDMCKPYYPDEMPKEIGAARGIVMGNGVNAGLGQILAANGCSRSGFCNFSVVGNTLLGTPDGLFSIESMVDKGPIQLQSTGLVTCKDILRQKDERAYRVYLESGVYLDCSAGHKWIRAIDHKKGNKEKTYTTRQVSNIVNKGGEFVVLRKIGNHFGVEWHSDLKIVNLREDSVLSSDEKCYQCSFGAPYSECKEQVNDLMIRLNFYGFDTGVLKASDNTTIEWWPMSNCATYDRVVSVEALNKIVPMYDVFDTDDHTVCYNGIVTHQCHEGSYCIPAGTGIKSSVGVTNIEDFKIGDEVVVRGNKYKVINTVEVGVREAKVITLSTNQEIKMANTHLMLVIEDGKLKYKRAYDLKVGDWLVYDNSQSFGQFTSKYAYLVGLILGDGCFRSDCEFEVCLPNSDKNSSIDGEFYKLFDKWHYSKKTSNVSSCVVYNREVGEYFKSIGFHCRGAKLKRIPKVFFNSDKETAKALLQGLFDTDGSISLSKKSGTATISYCSVNKNLIYDVIRMLSMFGIVSTVYRRLSKTSGHFMKSGKWIKHSDEVFEVVIVGESNIRVFESEVGFRLKRKVDKLKTRESYVYDVELIPTFEGRLSNLYKEDKEFNRAVRKEADRVKKIFMGWDKNTHFLSKRHFDKIFHLLPTSLKEDLQSIEGLKFYQIRNIEDVEPCMMYDVEVEDSHAYSIQGWLSHNTGGWVENTPERLVELAKLCRKHTASTTLKAYSFNSNYLSDYKRNIYDWLGVYPRVTFNNMRLEELGLDKDALKMMKLAGYQRMTAPLEGISERIRNNLLNKNLSEKALDSYLEYGMMMGAVDCKVGIVLTGYEEEQDWQAFYDFNMKWRKKCHDMGGNIPFRYKCTLLVHYPHTPVEFLERKAARHAFYGTYIMPNEWNDKYYQDHIRIKLNGFKHSTFIEQAIVDLGRYATPWMYNYIIRPGYPFYNTKTIVTHEEAWEAFRALVNPEYFFNERKMDEYISICHRIHIAMHANVVFQAKKILKDGADATPTIRCLKTYEGCPVDCKAHVYEKSPLITYGDAWLDESGKLTGRVWEEVKGCQRCKTPADRKKVLARELPMSKNADDILMYKAPSLELRLRFRIQRKKEYEVLSPRNTAFVFFTKFLRKSDDLCKMFWELDAYHNMFWQSEEDKTYVVSGQQIVDVTFTDRKAKELVENLIQEVNAEAKSFRVVSVREVPLTDKIKVDDYNVFYFESTLSAEFWQFAAMNYDGEVKVEGAQGAMETIKDVRLTAPSFTLRDKVKGYFTVPCKYSPWHYLQGLMAVRRISLSKLLATTSIQCITTVRESNGTCMCGKEKAVSDIGTNMQQKVGRDCLAAFLTSKL